MIITESSERDLVMKSTHHSDARRLVQVVVALYT